MSLSINNTANQNARYWQLAIGSVKSAADAGRFDNIDFSKALASKNPPGSGGMTLQQESYIIANYAGRDFQLYDPENVKYLDDPTVRVTETGYLVRQSETRGGTETGSLNFTIQILGKAVDAPEYLKSVDTLV
ncbi:MAG: hypothetical protein FWH17_07310 [Oscillospiraceae bacterium]|nr:hypothetical protein [Oscillospiraceae bacterium]